MIWQPADGQQISLSTAGRARIIPHMFEPGTSSTAVQTAFWRFWEALGGKIVQGVNIALPPMCPVCRVHVDVNGGVCADCWSNLSFIEPPVCNRLGTPFAYDPGPGIVSPQALAAPPAWNRVRGAVKFDETSRNLVHALKYRDRHEVAPLMARLICRAGADLLADCDFLVPVPLYPFRLWQRRFNQSALLGTHLQRQTGLSSRPDLLQRNRPTRPQVGLDTAGRKQNVRNAFAVPEEQHLVVKGKNCVIIDDVLTTGATAEACSKALLRAGAGRVDVIVFALVLNPSGRHI